MSDSRIGIMFNANMLKGLARGRTRHEAIAFYEDAARRHGVTPVFFRIEDVHLPSMRVLAYVRQHHRYVKQSMPIPDVIHNRAIFFRSRSLKKVESLVHRGIQIFNQVNRYGKMTIHDLISKDAALLPHLPETLIATKSSVASMMSRHSSLILKPDNSSIGKGLMKLDRTENGWKACYAVVSRKYGKRWRTQHFHEHTLPPIIIKRITGTRYLVQETLPLATYEGRPFDLRVSVQRDHTGQWQVTGIVGKVAPLHTFVTNVAQGGTVYTFEQIAAAACPHLSYRQMKQHIEEVSLRIVATLSDTLPHMADLGLDMGISKDGLPLFIECNGRDQRYSFREAHLIDTWRMTYENPMSYGIHLLNSKHPVG